MKSKKAVAAVIAALTLGLTGTAEADLSEKLRPLTGQAEPLHPLAECRLPTLGEPIEALRVEGNTPRRLDMPSQFVLVVLSLSLKSEDQGDLQFDTRPLPLLPNGGVNEADLCGPLETQKLRIPESGERLGVVSLRMRPSLDLATAYPAFGTALDKSGRTVRTKSKSFAAFTAFPNDEKILRRALLDHPLVQAESSLWTLPGLILVPLK